MTQTVLRSLMKKPRIYALVCDRSCVPEDCEWEEAQKMHQYYYNFLLLGNYGLIALRESDKGWDFVDFQTFQHYYALYLLGVPPIPQYIQDKADEKIQKQTD